MPTPRKYKNSAERVKAFRAKRGLVTVSVDLPVEVVAGLNEYLKFKDLKKSDVIAKLITSQLLRKR